jgi:DNA-binding MarR family transcriptional regulator
LAEGTDERSVEEIERLLRHVANIVRQRGREILSQFDITPPQFNALQALIRSDGMTMGELCQELFLASSTVTDLIDRMEKNDLVQRLRDEGDRRVVRLQVKDKGRRVLEEVMRRRRAYLASVLSALSVEECTRLRDSLKQIHDLMTVEVGR